MKYSPALSASTPAPGAAVLSPTFFLRALPALLITFLAAVPAWGQGALMLPEGATAPPPVGSQIEQSLPDAPETRERTAKDDADIAGAKARKSRRATAGGAAGPESVASDNPPGTRPLNPLDARRPGDDGLDALAKSAAAAGAPPVVTEVEVSGATGEDLVKATKVVRARKGEPVDPTRQRDDIRRLYETGLFRPDLNVEAVPAGKGRVKLRYTVSPNPKVGTIAVSGNSRVPTSKLLGELPVKPGEVYSPQAQGRIRERVARYYRDSGFHEAAVRVEERPAPGGGVDLALSVDEGTRVKIKRVEFRGNNAMGGLRMQMKMENRGSLGPMTKYYNASKFQEDLEKIKATYVAQGYLDCEVRQGPFTYADDRSWVVPVVDITEGPRYRVGQLQARGYSVFSRDEVTEPFAPLQGQWYNVDKFDRCAGRVKAMYGDEGFMNAEVSPDFRKDPARGVVDVDVKVDEGGRVYVGDVRVINETVPDDADMGWLRRWYSRFSPPVKDEVVRRQVRLQPGQVYRRFDEVKTKERLKALNVFDDVKIAGEMSGQTNVRDAVVHVKPGNTGNVIFGLGFGDVEGVFFYANYIEHNLFGEARDLRLSALVGSQALNLEAAYLDHFFRGGDTEARFALYHKQFIRTGSLGQRNTGGTVEMTTPKSEELKSAIRYRLESVGFDSRGNKPARGVDDYVAATVRYRLVRDTRDDTFFPTEGTIMAGGAEAGLAKSGLLKLEGQLASYFALGDDLVYSVNGIAGLMPYNADKVGYAERFFMGGTQDLRGFRVYGAGPHDQDNSAVPSGGAWKLVAQQELRRRLTDNLTGVAFVDAGVLSDKIGTVGDPRASAGVGARLRLPMANVAVDLGVPVLSKKVDQTQIFHFTLNSTF